MAKKNDKIYGITPAMATGGGLKRFGDEFPDRYRDVGIAEMTCVLMGAGLATEGFIPVCSVYSTFMQRSFDALIHDVGIQNLHVICVMDRGGIVGADGPTHHGVFDYSYMRCIPNFIVMSPKDENELQHMLQTAVDCKQPVSIRYPRGEGVGVALDEEFKSLEIGKAEMLVDHADSQVVIVAIGEPVYRCVEVSVALENEYGVKASVVNARFVKPLDEELLVRLAKKHRNIVTVEENVGMGGFGSAVGECLMDHDIAGLRLKRIAIDDIFVEHGGQGQLRKDHGLDREGIVKTILEFLNRSLDQGDIKEKPRPVQSAASF
jgi:1-deoxy-D-xylulose-5-phosphate synthase